MIDTIYVEISKELIGNTTYKDIKSNLFKHEKLWQGYDPNVHVGKMKNLRVKFFDDHIKIQGSIPKELYGNNIQIPSYKEIFDLFSFAEREYGLPIHRGHLTQIDFGYNFYMDNPVEMYLKCLQETPGYSFSRFKGSVYYHKDNYKLHFYDKGREIRKKMASDPSIGKLPSKILNANILRYEISIHSRLYQYFDFDSLKPVLVHSPTFRNRLFEIWQDRYWSIDKKKLLHFDKSLTTLPKLKPQVWLKGVEALGGLKSLVEEFKELKSCEQISQKQYDSLSSWTKRISKEADLISKEPLVEELNKKMRNVPQF